MICHLLLPQQAQNYWIFYFYEGPQNNYVAQTNNVCNQHWPLKMFISQIRQTGKENFIEIRRVFSGKIKQIKIMGYYFNSCSKEGIFIMRIEKTVGFLGNYI
ncbi:unnamed protein product [Paramecium pentaurelia]|uniref:Uncharacterized protein n=1 Tax=Paramecium pentaurelia TaxID=43138 RepID=A0A8S1WS26_9CILI|nr:unnamed protein product [Paramecium pentaurelia]